MLKAVGYNTLVIELLAKNLGHFNNRLKKHYPLGQLLADLTEKGLFGITTKEVSTAYQARDLGMRQEAPEAILVAMYDLGELEKAQQKILSVLSGLPAESIRYSVLEAILSEQQELDKQLLGLSAKGWLEYNPEKSAFKISPVVQEVVRRKNGATLWEDCRPLITILNHKLDYEPGFGHLKNIGYGEATVWAAYAEFAGSTLLPWFQTHLPEEDGLVLLLASLGRFHKTTGDLPKALFYFQTCEKLVLQLKDAYPQKVSFKNGLAILYSKLGDTHSSLGNLVTALGYYEQKLLLTKDLHQSHPQNMSFKNGLAISYQLLGQFYEDNLKENGKAKDHYIQARFLFAELHEAFPDFVDFKERLAWTEDALKRVE